MIGGSVKFEAGGKTKGELLIEEINAIRWLELDKTGD